MTNAAKIDLASHPRYLEAWLSRQEGSTDSVLVILASPIVGPSDEWRKPINEILSRSCSRVTEEVTTKDPFWNFGRFTRTEHTVYATCPGNEVEHSCPIKEEHGGGAQAA